MADIGVHGRIILKWVFEKYVGGKGVVDWMIRLRIVTRGGHL